MIRLFQPTLGGDELDAIAAVFEDQWPGPGSRVRKFERAFAAYLGVASEETIAVTSCTEGLFQAVDALRLRPTDEVVLPTVSFIGAAHAVRAAGARVRLADVDPVSLNPTVEHLEVALTESTKAILLLHFGGQLGAIHNIAEMARAHGIALIEDAACALGGRSGGVPYGTLGDIGVWSFDAMKLLVTGDGGMIRISDGALRTRVSERIRLGGAKAGLEGAVARRNRWWQIEASSWGRKASMNDLTAAIGLVQLEKIDGFVEQRRRIIGRYDAALRNIPWLCAGSART